MLDRPQVAAVIVGARKRQPSAGKPGDHGIAPDRGRPRRDRRGAGRAPRARKAIRSRSSATARPPWLDHEVQSQQAGIMTPLADRRDPRDRGAARRLRRTVHRSVARFRPLRRGPCRGLRDGDAGGRMPRPRSGPRRASDAPARTPISGSRSPPSVRSGTRRLRSCSSMLSNSIVTAGRPGADRRPCSTAHAEAPCGVVWRYLHETWMPNAGS